MKLRVVAIILLLSLLLFFGFKKVSPNKNKEQSTNIEQLSIKKYIPENNKLLFISNLDSFPIFNNHEKVQVLGSASGGSLGEYIHYFLRKLPGC